MPRPNVERRSLSRVPELALHTAGYGQLPPGLQRVQHGFYPLTTFTPLHHIITYHIARTDRPDGRRVIRHWKTGFAVRLAAYESVVRDYAGDLGDLAELTASDVEEITGQIKEKVKKRKFADAFAEVVAHRARGLPMSALLEVTNSPSFPARARLFARSFARPLARSLVRSLVRFEALV